MSKGEGIVVFLGGVVFGAFLVSVVVVAKAPDGPPVVGEPVREEMRVGPGAPPPKFGSFNVPGGRIYLVEGVEGMCFVPDVAK